MFFVFFDLYNGPADSDSAKIEIDLSSLNIH